MKVHKILVPIDFSGYSQAALEMATSLATAEPRLRCCMCNSFPWPWAAESCTTLPIPTTGKSGNSHGGRPDGSLGALPHRLVLGDPGSSILQVAEEEGIDLIVIPRMAERDCRGS